MGDKAEEEEGLKLKLGRKFSKKSSTRTPETPKVKPAASKSATLPPNMEAGAMASQQSGGSGIFSKLKRRLRLGSSKGKYDLKTSASPVKPRWSRRKSDESQLRRSKESIEDDTSKASTSSRKPSSAKTPRKIKTDKEEVILIRKDKRVSVICKAENGDAEVLFSNIENSDEDSSSAWGPLEEDPYATLNSVRDEVDQKEREASSSKPSSSSKSSLSSRDKVASPLEKSSLSTPSKTPDSAEEYPYARIDSSKKKLRKQPQQTPLKAKDFNLQMRARIRSQIEPDYETLEEVQHQKSELVSSGSPNVTANSSSLGDGMNTSHDSLDDLDPDYESLEEIQHKQRALSLHLPAQNLTLEEDSVKDASGSFDPYASLTRPKSYAASSGTKPYQSPSSVWSLDQQKHSQEDKLVLTSRSSRHSSASSISAAPLAAGVDTSLPSDHVQEHQTQENVQEAEEEDLYDNRNVLLRKQQQQNSMSTSSIGGAHANPCSGLGLGDALASGTHHHHHHIKTPAEEELVEKLSSLLAPPLPLRNYQKEEAYQMSSSVRGRLTDKNGSSKGSSSSARHSWSSQNSRHTMSEFLDAAAAGTGTSISPRSQQRWKVRSGDADGRRHSTYSPREWSGGESSPGSKTKIRKKVSSRESLASDKESCRSQDGERLFFTCAEVAKGSNFVPEANHVTPEYPTKQSFACESEKFTTELSSKLEYKSDGASDGKMTETAAISSNEIGGENATLLETSQENSSDSPLRVDVLKVSTVLLEDKEPENADCPSRPATSDAINEADSTEKELLGGKKTRKEDSYIVETASEDCKRSDNSNTVTVNYNTTYASVIKQVQQNVTALDMHCGNELNLETSDTNIDEISEKSSAFVSDWQRENKSVENGKRFLNKNSPSECLKNDELSHSHCNSREGVAATLQEFCRNLAVEIITKAVKQCHRVEEEKSLNEPVSVDDNRIFVNVMNEMHEVSPTYDQDHTACSESLQKRQQNSKEDSLCQGSSESAENKQNCKPSLLRLDNVPSFIMVHDSSSSTSQSEDAVSDTATPSEDCGILATCSDCIENVKDFETGQGFGILNTSENQEHYRSQGARPKVVPLPFPTVGNFSGASHKKKELAESHQTFQAGSEIDAPVKDWHSDDDIGVWDDTLSPSVPDMDFCDFVGEREDILQLMNLGAGLQGVTNQGRLVRARNRLRMEPELRVQETVYVDSDSDAEVESIDGKDRAGQASKDGATEVHKSFVIKVQRDFSITKVVRPIVYANPRLLENVISGKFKFDPSLDKDYICYGVFKRGRFFSYLSNDVKSLVDEKLKAYFNAKRDEFNSGRRFKTEQLRQMQNRTDELQVKIDKKLEEVKDLPTFHDVRMHLLKTHKMDSWEPERANGRKYCSTPPEEDIGIVRESSKTETNISSAQACVSTPPAPTESKTQSGACNSVESKTQPCVGSEIGSNSNNMSNYSRKPQPCNDFQFENTIFLEEQREEELLSPQLCPSPGNSMETVLDDFSKLCDRALTCKRCGDSEESDTEDEQAALDVYVRTVGPRFSRALHGELAYTTYIRPSRQYSETGTAGLLFTMVKAVGACHGASCHLSWQDWSAMDLHFRKLVPHSSPRLDFQFLLKTYAELKHFVLKERRRNSECKGCYVKAFLWQAYQVDGHQQSQESNSPKCSRVEEFVFLKLLRDELYHFGHMIRVSAGARALFVEERDIGHTCLFLLRTILRIIHRMKRRIQLARVRQPADSSFAPQDLNMIEDHRQFHISNFLRFRADSMLDSLRTWMTPEDYSPDPNILVSGRTVVAHTDSRSLELAGMLGVAEPQPLQEGEDFVESMQQLQSKEWYWGPISYEEAAMILQDKEDGSFLVRDSSDHKYLLSLSFKSLGEIHHTRMEHAKGLFSFWSQPESHGKARICEFIDKSVQNSRDGRFLYFLRPSARGVPPLPIRLLNPVSRNFRVASLKHLSRFVVRQNVRKDHLNRLPVPEKVKRYLKEKQYYAEIPDEDQWPFCGESTKF